MNVFAPGPASACFLATPSPEIIGARVHSGSPGCRRPWGKLVAMRAFPHTRSPSSVAGGPMLLHPQGPDRSWPQVPTAAFFFVAHRGRVTPMPKFAERRFSFWPSSHGSAVLRLTYARLRLLVAPGNLVSSGLDTDVVARSCLVPLSAASSCFSQHRPFCFQTVGACSYNRCVVRDTTRLKPCTGLVSSFD